MIRSAREVTDALDLATCDPRPEVLSECDENEAFVLADGDGQYAVYFPSDGSVVLDDDRSSYACRWYDVEACQWYDEEADDREGEQAVVGTVPRVSTPYNKQWVALLTPLEADS